MLVVFFPFLFFSSSRKHKMCYFLAQQIPKLNGAQDTVKGFNTHTHTHTALKPCQTAECRIWVSTQPQLDSNSYYGIKTCVSVCVCFYVCVEGESDEPSLGHVQVQALRHQSQHVTERLKGFRGIALFSCWPAGFLNQ